MKRIFIAPEINVQRFEADDIIRVSGARAAENVQKAIKSNTTYDISEWLTF